MVCINPVPCSAALRRITAILLGIDQTVFLAATELATNIGGEKLLEGGKQTRGVGGGGGGGLKGGGRLGACLAWRAAAGAGMAPIAEGEKAPAVIAVAHMRFLPRQPRNRDVEH